MRGVFYIVGPTATGKSHIAAAVAERCNAEIVGADAFQVYQGLARVTAQPDAATLARVRHHLVGTVPANDEMSAAKFREMASAAIAEIHTRDKGAIVVGGSGLYLRALTDGLSALPPADPEVRQKLNELTLAELTTQLLALDPTTAESIDRNNKRRVLRAVEICLLTQKPTSHQRKWEHPRQVKGVFVTRDRDDLYKHINRRVERMFADGVVEEIKGAGDLGPTAEQALGVRDIRQLIAGEMTEPECIAAIQQATRRYAKRQLTWFRRQTNFEPLNLSSRSDVKSIELIAQRARLCFAND